MYEKCLNEAELTLSAHKEPLLPVRTVWEEVAKRSKALQFEVASLPDFTALLEGDRRFQIIPGKEKNEDADQPNADELELEEEGMGQLGFYHEDRVRLRNAPVAPESPGEDEEEVGSIRRRAFVNHSVSAKAIGPVGKNGAVHKAKPAAKSAAQPKKAAKKSTKKIKPRKSVRTKTKSAKKPSSKAKK